MKHVLRKNATRAFRKVRNRAKITGTAERPRLSVFRSNKYTYVQLIDDSAGKTLLSIGTRGEKTHSTGSGQAGTKKDHASRLGEKIAEAATKAGIKKIVFDRGQYAYHGRLASLADAARKGGLEF